MFVLDAFVALSYTFACIKTQEVAIHMFTLGVAAACVAGALAGATAGTTGEWDWFSWAKRISLLIGWLGFFAAWQAQLCKGPRANLCQYLARRFLSLILMLNVAEAAVVMLLQGNYVGGLFCALIAFLAPDWCILDKHGRLGTKPEATCLGLSLPGVYLSDLWYFRSYYVVLSFCLCMHPRFKDFWVFVYISCLWPLFLQEVFRSVNPGIIFKIRAFLLIAVAALMDTLIYTDALEMSTPLAHIEMDDLLMINAISAGVLVFFLGSFFALDKLRGGDDSDYSDIGESEDLA